VDLAGLMEVVEAEEEFAADDGYVALGERARSEL
jgi:hypothetical protein